MSILHITDATTLTELDTELRKQGVTVRIEQLVVDSSQDMRQFGLDRSMPITLKITAKQTNGADSDGT